MATKFYPVPFGHVEVRVDSPYAWLNSGLYLSSNPGPSTGGVALTFYESTR